MTTIALVGCSARKRKVLSQAEDLYIGTLFRLSRLWAERFADRWLIISAKLGIVEPSQLVIPYKLNLKKLSKRERESWVLRTREELRKRVAPGDRFILLAASEYGRCASDIDGCEVVEPMRGLRIGKRLAWLKLSLGGI